MSVKNFRIRNRKAAYVLEKTYKQRFVQFWLFLVKLKNGSKLQKAFFGKISKWIKTLCHIPRLSPN